MLNKFTISLQVFESHFSYDTSPGLSLRPLMRDSLIRRLYTPLLVFIPRCRLKLLTYLYGFARQCHPLWQRLYHSSVSPQNLEGWLVCGGYSLYTHIYGAVSFGGGG